jgi:hypothetical protein
VKWYIELERSKYMMFGDLAMVFLNHFQLPVWYDVGTNILANFEQDNAMHISDHIWEWRRQKSLIKAMVPPEFLLEWFLKSLLPYISKDVATSGVFSEEQAIFRAQQLELIYSQSRMLYEIMPNAPRSTLDLEKPKSGPHVDGIVGSSQRKSTDLVSNQMQQLSIQQTVVGPASGSTTPTTQSSDVHTVQSKTQKGPQHPMERKIKEKERRVVGEMTKILTRMLRGKRVKREK